MKNDFFGFPKVKWLHLAGEVDKSVRCPCQIFSGFNYQKLLKSVNFWHIIQRIKRWTFWGTQGILNSTSIRADTGVKHLSVCVCLYTTKYSNYAVRMSVSSSSGIFIVVVEATSVVGGLMKLYDVILRCRWMWCAQRGVVISRWTRLLRRLTASSSAVTARTVTAARVKDVEEKGKTLKSINLLGNKGPKAT